MAGARTEVYLGRSWTDVDLRAKVAMKMVADARREFLSAVETVVRAERIKWLEQEAARLRQEMNDVASRAQKENRRIGNALKKTPIYAEKPL